MEAPAAPVNLSPGLYLIATPIGNLRDITLRALDVLAGMDAIACEDTRTSRPLLDRYSIDRPLLAYHEHNAARIRPRLIARLTAGEKIALISDAGTPLVSDPGYKLVEAAVAAGVDVIPIPGPSAPLAGLMGAGLPSDSFLFAGFLPDKEKALREKLGELLGQTTTVIVFEAARRLPRTLAFIAEAAPDRAVVVARELTKKFEEFARGTAVELARRYHEEGAPRGEVVLLWAPAPEVEAGWEQVDRALALALNHLRVKEASALVAELTGHRKSDVYARALEGRRK